MNTRLFVAIPIGQNACTPLEGIQSQLSQIISSNEVRWVRPDAFHVTVRFLGNVPENVIKHLKQRLSEVARQSACFSLFPQGIECHQLRYDKKMIWLRLEDSRAFEKLVLDVGTVCRQYCDISDEEQTPHITLGKGVFENITFKKISGDLLPSIEVTHIHLYSSKLLQTGAVYTPLSTHSFSGDYPNVNA